MTQVIDWLMQSSGGVATVLLALSGLLFLAYVLTIAGLIGWQKVRGR